MTIDELNALTTLTATDEIPVWDSEESGEPTKKITAQNFAAAIKTLASLLGTGDVVNNLTNPSTTTIPSSAAVANIIGANNAGFHNSIYRGKNLGSSYTAAQSAQVQEGTFDDLFLGDYWTIGGTTYVIAGFDLYYRCGDTISLGHHIVVIPSDDMGSSVWNETNDTSTGYVGSKIRENIKASGGAESSFVSAFGSTHVLNYRAIYPTTYSSGKATGWAWTDARTELMTEEMVYGHQVWTGNDNGIGNGYECGIDKFQLPLFRVAPEYFNIRSNWWLRSVHSATGAANVFAGGAANDEGASNSSGVRPFSLIA